MLERSTRRHPWVYDSIQFLAGAPITRGRLREYLTECRERVLHIGGGTGARAALLPAGCHYTCLDNEMPKQQRCSERRLGDPLLADATRMPIDPSSIDVVACIYLAHYLSIDQLDSVLRETAGC